MTFPLPCPTSPFNWPADLNRYGYEHVSSICGVSADFIYSVDRGEPVGGDADYLRERIERVNFTLAELAAGRGPYVIAEKLARKELRAREAHERRTQRGKGRDLRKELDELTRHGRKMGLLPPAEKPNEEPQRELTQADVDALIAHNRGIGEQAFADEIEALFKARGTL